MLKGSFFIRFAVVKNDFTRDRERRERGERERERERDRER